MQCKYGRWQWEAVNGEQWYSATRNPTSKMSQGQQENVHDATGQGGVDEIPEFVGSDVVDRNTRVISQNLVEILTDPDAP